MDWSRAKNILIIAFLLTNIILAFNIYNGYRDLLVSDQEISEVIEILNEKGIEINSDIPRDASIPGILTVEYREFVPAKLAAGFFGDASLEPIKQDDSTIFMGNGKKLEVKNNSEIIYLDLSLKDELKSDLAANDAVNISKDFLIKTGLYNSSMIVDEVISTEKGYSVTYAQKYEDKPLEVSIVQLEVTPRGVYSLYMLWLNPKSMENDRKKIIPASQAVLKVVSTNEIFKNASVKIEDIKLVYYFNWKGAKEGEAFPAWKIRVNEENYYINALTGQYHK